MALNKHFTVIVAATNQKVGGSNPFRRAIKDEIAIVVVSSLVFMLDYGIRTREGLSVKKTVQWTVFSEEHNANSSFAL